ncbi:MAG: TVP38/TMEM64 family protein [Denitrovibrio sp.]|nr:MAG: TVP38/TMEM64 family protein [Denitrovibrio sp.]
MLTFESLKTNSDALQSYVESNHLISLSLFMFIYIVVAGLNLPGAVILSLSGGFVFGTTLGTLLAVTGATIGAGLGFLMSRYLLGETLNKKYETQLAKFNNELTSNGYMYMLTLRLIPIFPFFLINILAGLTKLKLRTFLWTSFMGMIPGGFVFVYAGSRLNEISSVNDIFSPQILSAFILLGLLMLVPVIYKKLKSRG